MKNKNFVVFSCVMLGLLVASFFLNVYGLKTSTEPYQYICNMLAIFICEYYFIAGYNKDGSIYFKLYAGMLSIKEAIALVHMIIHEQVPVLSIIIIGLCLLSCVLLTFAKDLGKSMSYLLVIILNVCALLAFIYTLISARYASVIILNITRMLLTLIMGLMVYFKYKDKAKRNTK